jgi:hypothetical protein
VKWIPIITDAPMRSLSNTHRLSRNEPAGQAIYGWPR